MGFGTQPSVGQHLDHIADHARSLQSEARAALQQGDFARAEALIECAGMLAYDVGSLVDELEERQLRDCLQLLAEEQAKMDDWANAGAAGKRASRRWLKRISAALGAGVAISFALVEY
jgi:hypothetical protein